jgi:hypothetical protein
MDLFEHKSEASKCTLSMVGNIGQELKKLEEIDLKSSEIITKYMDGQLGLL